MSTKMNVIHFFRRLIIFSVSLSIFYTYGMDGFVESWMKDKFPKFNQVVGEGGQGRVWASSENGWALKVSPCIKICHENKFEFKFQEKAFLAYCHADNCNNFKNRVRIPKPMLFGEESHVNGRYVCYLKMERLFPLDESLYQNYTRVSSLIHVLLGKNSIRSHIKSQGLFLGYQEVEALVNNERNMDPDSEKSNIELLCWDMGRVLAIMQLGAKISPYDCEYVLARPNQDQSTRVPYQLFVIDFGKTKDVEDNFKNYFRLKELEKKGKFASASLEWVQSANQLPGILEAEIRAIMKGDIKSDCLYVPTSDKRGFVSFLEGYVEYAHELANKENQPFYLGVASDFLTRLIDYETDESRRFHLISTLRRLIEEE